jgi:hypothetical protein
MKQNLLKVSIRQKAVYIPEEITTGSNKSISETTSVLVANASKLGFAFSEELLHALNNVTPNNKLELLETLKEITGVNTNWTPLVKEWNIPTGESVIDHIITLFGTIFQTKKGIKLDCGHIIPQGTFPLERYNGCPFCGTPFEFGKIKYQNQGSKLKVLELWRNNDLNQFYSDLLKSKTALDATQIESLKTLLTEYDLPQDVEIGIKETLMLVIDVLVENDRSSEAQIFFNSPTDILRYLWYKQTGCLQIIEPKTIINRISKNHSNVFNPADRSGRAKLQSKANLKLKYSRSDCKRVATWLNHLDLAPEKACEIMHPKRGMWVRFIRALRLAEYSKRKGFENLAKLLDVFYNEDYEVWQGMVNHYKLKSDAENTFKLLKQRPGLFARSLFSNMLWFGDDVTLKHFSEIIDKIPARLVFTLSMYAQIYFDKNATRNVKPLGGINKRVPSNKLLQLYKEEHLKEMQSKIEDLCLKVMTQRFTKAKNTNKTIYIDEGLFNIPMSIGDRSESVQDLPSALMGTRFPVEGNVVRLFLQWGKGLPAQHLDMDLSCSVAYKTSTSFCSYSQLVIEGCKHSGDIQKIPAMIGTAEYIDVNLEKLESRGAKYVSFTCNAYTNGSLSPNLVVGWMDSKYPMKISSKTGVAYDPSCVQHQVRITQKMSKGLVFGVLDVKNREIIWLEMSFGGQVVQNLDVSAVEALLVKLNSKLNIGNLLTLKAEAQGLELVSEAKNADESYDIKWATNTAKVTQLLID